MNQVHIIIERKSKTKQCCYLHLKLKWMRDVLNLIIRIVAVWLRWKTTPLLNSIRSVARSSSKTSLFCPNFLKFPKKKKKDVNFE